MKYLSIPVTNEQNQLVGLDGLLLVEQGSTTTVVMTYQGGKVITITHATAGAGDETQRDAIQNAVVAALSTGAVKVTYQVGNLPYAVSGIAIA
jgi:hypothetical protein